MVGTVVTSTSDVDYVRRLLTQAGRQGVNVRDKDRLAIFDLITIYTDYADIFDIAGVWLETDITGSGTNFISSGALIFPKEHRIVLSGSLPVGTNHVLMTYVARDGLSDDEVQVNIDMAKDYLTLQLWEDSINFSGTTTYDTLAKMTMRTLASYFSILAINNGNAIQSGFNYRLGEYEIQTKLWGEGMIAETLLANYWARAMEMVKMMKIYQAKPGVPIFAVDRSQSRVAYNKDSTIFHQNMIDIGRAVVFDEQGTIGITFALN